MPYFLNQILYGGVLALPTTFAGQSQFPKVTKQTYPYGLTIAEVGNAGLGPAVTQNMAFVSASTFNFLVLQLGKQSAAEAQQYVQVNFLSGVTILAQFKIPMTVDRANGTQFWTCVTDFSWNQIQVTNASSAAISLRITAGATGVSDGNVTDSDVDIVAQTLPLLDIDIAAQSFSPIVVTGGGGGGPVIVTNFKDLINAAIQNNWENFGAPPGGLKIIYPFLGPQKSP